MLDVGHLDPAEAAEIGELVRAARLEELPAAPAPGDGPPLGGRRPGPGVDRFGYVLTVESGGQERRVLLGEEDLTPERRALVSRLEAHAGQQRGSG